MAPSRPCLLSTYLTQSPRWYFCSSSYSLSIVGSGGVRRQQAKNGLPSPHLIVRPSVRCFDPLTPFTSSPWAHPQGDWRSRFLRTISTTRTDFPGHSVFSFSVAPSGGFFWLSYRHKNGGGGVGIRQRRPISTCAVAVTAEEPSGRSQVSPERTNDRANERTSERQDNRKSKCCMTSSLTHSKGERPTNLAII